MLHSKPFHLLLKAQVHRWPALHLAHHLSDPHCICLKQCPHAHSALAPLHSLLPPPRMLSLWPLLHSSTQEVTANCIPSLLASLQGTLIIFQLQAFHTWDHLVCLSVYRSVGSMRSETCLGFSLLCLRASRKGTDTQQRFKRII